MKKIIILRHNGGRLANQLINYISIYAYGLEKGYKVTNPSFFEYNELFPNLENKSFFLRLLNKLPNKYARKIYYILYLFIKVFINKKIVFANNKKIYLDKTPLTGDKYIYTSGRKFRNPSGLKKFHKELLKIFNFKEVVINEVTELINKEGEEINVGVHIRRGDYRIFKNGELFYTDKEIKDILLSFQKAYNGRNIKFFLVSDEKIDINNFMPLNCIKGYGSVDSDLFLLSQTDIIIGAKSTFGMFASFYGDIPLVNFSRGDINRQNKEYKLQPGTNIKR